MKSVKLALGKPRGGTMDVFQNKAHASLLAAAAVPPPAPPPANSGGDDPLDAFLAELHNEEAEKRAAKAAAPAAEVIEQTDAGEGYVARLDSAYEDDEDEGVGEEGALIFDDDGNVVGVRHSAADAKSAKAIAPLPAVDHASIAYPPFERCFYAPVSEIAALTPREVAEARAEAGISVSDADGLAPVRSFMQLCLDAAYPSLIAALANAGFEAPTGIQSQALPALLSGRDVIGVAHTGSGKTLAYALPAIRHCIAQPKLTAGGSDGPIALVLAPTRELSAQIAAEVRRFGRAVGLQVALLSGGSSQWEQTLALRAGAEIVVATPGRLIDHIKAKSTHLRRTTFLVIDEADRLFEMGFQQQVYSILGQIRPDRQTALFSATFRGKVERLAAAATRRPVRITVGAAGGQAAVAVTQHFHVLAHSAKWAALVSVLPGLLAQGKVVVFVSGKAAADELAANLNLTAATLAPHLQQQGQQQPLAVALHGDKAQSERDAALSAFRKSPATAVLVATDLASRGLHISAVAGVVNFDAAKNADTHVHRIGRTGRIGADGAHVPGTAHTFIMPHEAGFAAGLVRNLQVSGIAVPPEVLAIARRHPGFHLDDDAGSGGGARAGGGGSGGSASGMRRDGSYAGPKGGGGGGAGPGGGFNTGLGFGTTDDDASPLHTRPVGATTVVAGRGLTGGGPFVRATTSSANFAAGSLSAPLTAPTSSGVGGVVLGPQGFRVDDESAAAAGAAAWARLHAPPGGDEHASAGAAAPAPAPAPALAGLEQGVTDVIAAVRAAQAIGRQVDSSALSAVLASASAAHDGDDAGDVCLEDDEADMTRVRRKRVAVYAGGAAGSARSAAVAELSGQARGQAAQTYSSRFTSGGIIGGGAGVAWPDSASGFAQSNASTGRVGDVDGAEAAVTAAAALPPAAAAGIKRSRWAVEPGPDLTAQSTSTGASDVAAGAAGSAAAASEGGLQVGGTAAAEPAPPRKASRFGPPVAALSPPASVAQPQIAALAAAAAAAVVPGASAGVMGGPFAVGSSRGLYIPGVRY